MQKLLLVALLVCSNSLFAQKGFLYVKKKGYKKVRTFEEGNPVKFRTKDDQIVFGTMALVKKDSILVNNKWFGANNIKTIYLRDNHYQFDSHTFWLTTAAVALAAVGMTLAGWASFGKSLGYSAAFGYGSFLLRNLPDASRKKYNIGKKYSLQTFDLHF